MNTLPIHLQAKNILKAFNPAISGQELMERAALMQDKQCTGFKIDTLNKRWSK